MLHTLDAINYIVPASTAALVDMSQLLLLRNLLGSPLEILTGGKPGLVHGGNKQRGLGEEVAHLLQGSVGGLGEDGPEEDGVGHVADLVLLA